MGSVDELDILVDQVLSGGSTGNRGARAVKLRDLSKEDVAGLWHLRDGDLETSGISVLRIRHTHHALARLIAEGRKFTEVAAITGYSNSYISVIQNDPAFKNLITFYKENLTEVYVSVHERMASISMLAADELQIRLTENPEEFSRRELTEVLEKTADRTGFGPRTTQVNVNLDLADRLQKARDRVLSADHASPALNGPEASRLSPVLDLRPNKELVE